MNLLEHFKNLFDQHELWEDEITLKRYEYLKVQGAANTNLYYVISGSLRAYIIDEFEEHTIRLGYKDNLVAAMVSFITEQPTNLYLQTLKKTRLKVMSKARLMEFINADADRIQAWSRFL
ncbi:cyclic nucleotide-binding domain-containing protein [Gilvibacter sp.]|uniref:cyclic nucleotide-binding domain-containing protein n=1 Tax=Gilvibacter sp. TaxID=2729997 RepID=UPI0035BEA4A2